MGIQHKLGVVREVRGDGELVHVELDGGRLVKLCAEEVEGFDPDKPKRAA